MSDPYIPVVGDIVTYVMSAGPGTNSESIVVATGQDSWIPAKQNNGRWVKRVFLTGDDFMLTLPESLIFVRKATKAELKKFGLITKKPPTSRPDRWFACVEDLKAAKEEIDAAIEKWNAALEDLRSVQEEYVEWRDNLPENLQTGALGEKLNAVADLDLSDADEFEAGVSIDDIEGVDLPQGFGRD